VVIGDKEVLRGLTRLTTPMLAGVVLYATVSLAGPSPAPLRARANASEASQSASARDLSGKEVNPFEDAAGKPVIFIFVRTDCPISNRYAPTIQALSQKYSGIAIIMLVYPDKSETSQSIEQHRRAYGYRIPALRDPRHSLVKLSEVEVTPEAAVFSADRELVYHGRIDNWYKEFGRARSAPTTHELDDAIQAALDSRHPAPASVGGVGCYISDLQ
jgi:thiol-disulfide isomerase/thioredoxin